MTSYVIEIPQKYENKDVAVQKLRVAAYCRVSTKHDEQTQSIESQIAYYTQYIKENPNWTFTAIYADRASGLSTQKRPGYEKLLRDCRKQKIDLIIVKALSRFGRDTLETISQIRRLKQMNIGVYVENIGMNTLDTPDVLLSIWAARDQEESLSKSQNIKFGIQQRMREGGKNNSESYAIPRLHKRR